MTPSKFIHLHVHSDYSPMRGVSPLAVLCESAKRYGMTSLAVTDTNGLYGAIRFIEEARHYGIRPILGAELTAGEHRTVLLIKTLEGYSNLCRLLSERHSGSSFDFVTAVARHRSGLILITDDEEALTAWGHDARQDLYVELTPGPAMHRAVQWSRRTGVPPVASNRVYFANPSDIETHRLLRAIDLNTTLSRLPPEACCSPTQWLASPEHMTSQFPHVPEALENTVRIAGACHSDWTFGKLVVHAFQGLSDEAACVKLRKQTYEGAAARYGVVSHEIRERIEKELAVIRDNRFAHYFLIVQDIVWSRLTCGRGSVAASIVSYCLGITHVDPLTHKLFFERFLNSGRKDPPDIDIDFPWDERDKIINDVFKQYAGRIAMVANQNSLGLRAAIRETAKVHGMPAQEITAISSRIMRQQGFLKAQTREQWVHELSGSLRLHAPWPDILYQALGARNHFRHLSQHCGGVVIVPDDIRRYVPIESTTTQRPVIQWEKDQAEEAGLVKIDLLGNRSLAVIRDALAAIASHTGRLLDYAYWDPLQDEATKELIQRGDTIGCFYVESPATRLLLKKLWSGMPAACRATADVFEYLVVVSSLVRPAAITFVHDFVRRAHGEQFKPLHEKLKPILAETFGIMVYQEDVTKVAMALADFSVEDADQLRKIISKKHKERQLGDYYRQFCQGAARNGASPLVIEQIWRMIMSFAGYSFCKPHSASYAQVSFKAAYLRAHHPAEFMAAVISNQGGFYSTFAYLSEARRMGLAILPPDINASDWAYRGEGDRIRMGLMQVKTISKDLGEQIIKKRTEGGPFRSFSDFLKRVNLKPSQARALIRAGCCDAIAGELTRPALLWRLYAEACLSSGPLPVPEDYSALQKQLHERESFGFLISRHPLTLYRRQIERLRPVPASRMGRFVGHRITMVGWLITEKSVTTKSDLPMEFITLEDTTALYDGTLFPNVYRRCHHLLAPDRPYIVRGLVEEMLGAVTLTVHDLQLLEGKEQESEARIPPEPWYENACNAVMTDPPLRSSPSDWPCRH
nr:DNA polymerase III subunit alpha [Nitrospira sp. KM1]